jgi:shikimate dehydrogenase
MKKFYIVGNPVAHSLSPKLFKYIFNFYKINAEYNLFNARSIKEFEDFINDNDGIHGFNITLPFKKLAFSNLKSIDTSIINTKSVNCIDVRDGFLKGYNTDKYGFINMIEKINMNFNDYDILLLGNGGSASTVIDVLLTYCNSDIYIWGRNNYKVEQFISNLSECNRNRISRYSNNLKSKTIVINCISYNISKRDTKTILSYLPINNINYFIDINYFDTMLTKELKKQHIKVQLGTDMFIYQAIKTFDIWFENKYADDSLYDRLKEVLLNE